MQSSLSEEELQKYFAAGSAKKEEIYSKCLQLPGLCFQMLQKSGVKLCLISKKWDQTPNVCYDHCYSRSSGLRFFSPVAFHVHQLFISFSAQEIIWEGGEWVEQILYPV